MNLTEELLLAFEGFDGAHGQTEVSNQRMNGKQKAKSTPDLSVCLNTKAKELYGAYAVLVRRL